MEATELPVLPRRVFASGYEPVGERVNSYFKLNTIRVVTKALLPEELEIIRPAFGKLIDAYSKPAFSGKLAHFLLTRQLDINKAHELWVIFCGSPIRFSLREFAIVTVLNCNPIPEADPSTLKAKPGVTPYWFTLFGGEENVTGEILTTMLKKSKNLSSEMRIKYACLLLVDGLLCRRSFHMKIRKEHAEMIRDLDYFLAYPWGRHTFNVTMENIKKKSQSQLAQITVAVQGFVHALQLVVLEEVPASQCAVTDGTDPESGDEDNAAVTTLKLDKLWDLDEEGEVQVFPIIKDPSELCGTMDFTWPDVPHDEGLTNLESLISEEYSFHSELFTGGATDFANRAEEVNPNAQKRKRNKGGRRGLSGSDGNCSSPKKSKASKKRVQYDPGEVNPKLLEAVAAQVRLSMSETQSFLAEKLAADVKQMESAVIQRVTANVENLVATRLAAMKSDEVIVDVMTDINASFIDDPSGGDEGTAPVLNKPIPALKKTLLKAKGKKKPTTIVPKAKNKPDTPAADVVDFEAKYKYIVANAVESRDLNFGPGLLLHDADLHKIPVTIPTSRHEVMDSCVMVYRESLLNNIDPSAEPRADILTCYFIAELAKQYSKFKKATRKDNFEFESRTIGFVRGRAKEANKVWFVDIDYIYFPFNVDKNSWTAAMVDLNASTLTIFDPHAQDHRGSRMKQELHFVCEMLPYVIRKAAVNEEMKSFSIEPLSFSRDANVPQASDPGKTGLFSLLFIEAHATGGYSRLQEVNEGMLAPRGQKLAVQMYEHCCGDIFM